MEEQLNGVATLLTQHDAENDAKGLECFTRLLKMLGRHTQFTPKFSGKMLTSIASVVEETETVRHESSALQGLLTKIDLIDVEAMKNQFDNVAGRSELELVLKPIVDLEKSLHSIQARGVLDDMQEYG